MDLRRLQGLVDGLADAAPVLAPAIVPNVIIELLLDAEEGCALTAAEVTDPGHPEVGARGAAAPGAPGVRHEAAVASYQAGQVLLLLAALVVIVWKTKQREEACKWRLRLAADSVRFAFRAFILL
jgi:hypothetical protein